jgi:signal transduction histidine kinase
MQRASIGRQLNIGLVASLLLAATLLGVVASFLFERALREYALEGLHADAQSVLAAIERGPSGLMLDSARLVPSYHTPLSGRYFVVGIGDTRWRSRSLWDTDLWSSELPASAGALPALVDGPQRQRLLCLRADYRHHGSDVVIVVAADVAPLLKEFRRIGFVLLGVGVAIVVLLAWLQRVWMRRALSPLMQAQLQLRELQQGRRNLLETDAPAELQPLIAEINRLLQYTRQSLTRSRNALGNLGHALKTPLAVLVSIADRAEPSLREPLQEQLAQMQRRIGRELGRARTAGDVTSGIWFAPQQDLPLLMESLQRAHGNAPDIVWQAPAQALPLERDDMLELLGNLLDNACKWARLRIELSMDVRAESASSLQLHIELQDDGPGIDEALRTQVMARGSRLDEHTEGHGLGLGIVSDIVAAYRGEITLSQAGIGGLGVSVNLPLTATAPLPVQASPSR